MLSIRRPPDGRCRSYLSRPFHWLFLSLCLVTAASFAGLLSLGRALSDFPSFTDLGDLVWSGPVVVRDSPLCLSVDYFLERGGMPWIPPDASKGLGTAGFIGVRLPNGTRDFWATEHETGRWIALPPQESTDVDSGWTTVNGEWYVSEVVAVVAQAFCAQAQLRGWRHRPLVLDVGANTGLYGLAAIAEGCQALFFDPQATCVHRIVQGLVANGEDFLRRGCVVPRPVADTRFDLPAISPAIDCDGRVRAEPARVLATPSPSPHPLPPGVVAAAPGPPLSSVVLGADLPLSASEVIALVKVDVEGAELPVLRSLLPFLERLQVRHLVVEVSPIFWEDEGRLEDTVEEASLLFRRIWALGYRARLLSPSQFLRPLDSFEDVVAFLRGRSAPRFGQVDMHWWSPSETALVRRFLRQPPS